MEQAILNEVISIRNRLGAIIVNAHPSIGKEWKTFRRLVNAHAVLQGIEIDKSTPMTDDKQPTLPGTPERIDNICSTCGNFEACEFEVKKTKGVSDCEDYCLMVPESTQLEDPIKDREITSIQDMPHSDLSEEEKAKLTEIKQDVNQEPVSLASFEVVKTAEVEGEEHTVSMCGHTASHKTLRGAVMFLLQEIGFIYQTPEDMKEAILKFPDCDKRGLIIGILDSDEETKKRSRRKKE